MENIIQVASVPLIVTVVYFVISIYKTFVKEKAKIYFEIIPIIAAVLGVIIGILAYFIAPEIIPADNILVAILIGGASGLASTGTNQIFKQIEKKERSNDNTKNENNKRNS